LKTVSKL
jgi:hypothetical protein